VTSREFAHELIDRLPEERIADAVRALQAIERDALLLAALRDRHPDKTEAELMQSLGGVKRGAEVTDEFRKHIADLSSEGIEPRAVEAVREVRRERDAKRRTRRTWSWRRARTP
jgi:hypothetical protein